MATPAERAELVLVSAMIHASSWVGDHFHQYTGIWNKGVHKMNPNACIDRAEELIAAVDERIGPMDP